MIDDLDHNGDNGNADDDNHMTIWLLMLIINDNHDIESETYATVRIRHWELILTTNDFKLIVNYSPWLVKIRIMTKMKKIVMKMLGTTTDYEIMTNIIISNFENDDDDNLTHCGCVEALWLYSECIQA